MVGLPIPSLHSDIPVTLAMNPLENCISSFFHLHYTFLLSPLLVTSKGGFLCILQYPLEPDYLGTPQVNESLVSCTLPLWAKSDYVENTKAAWLAWLQGGIMKLKKDNIWCGDFIS